jgi:2OG-Fe(II) oxygenase superfamily
MTNQSNAEFIKSLRELNDFNEIVNFEKYPIQNLKSPAGQALLSRCRQAITEHGASELPEFITPRAIAVLQSESAILQKNAYYKPVVGNAYLKPGDPSLPIDHPLNMTEATNVGVIAYDQYPQDSLLRRIYEWNPLMEFIGEILNLPAIYRYGDPMGGLNLAVMRKEDYLRWHFDQTDFVTSLSIQSSESGGEFEYSPLIRSETNENFSEVKNILTGDRSKVINIKNQPGTLVLFKGRFSIHRVTKVTGSRPRWMGLFGFDSKPNICSTPHLLEMRYGRQHPLTTKPTF